MPRLAVLILILLVIGLAAFGGYRYIAAAAVAREIGVQRAALADARQYAVDAARAQADSRAIAARVTARPAPWTWSEQLPVLVTQITGIVEGGGAKVETLQPAPVVERQQVLRFPLRMTLHTDLAALSRVLHGVQQASPLLAVDQLVIRTGQKPGDPLTIDLTLSSYVTLDNRQKGGTR